MRSPLTKKQCPGRLKLFFDPLGLEGEGDSIEEQGKAFLAKAKREEAYWAGDSILFFLDHHKQRVLNKEGLAAGTLNNYYQTIKTFCKAHKNDLPPIDWERISNSLPQPKSYSNDRAPTVEEIRKVVKFSDRRIKSIVYVMTSSGIRIDAWRFLKWKHVVPKTNEKGEIIAAKLTVYAEEHDEYYSFLTPEAYAALKEWMDYRALHGEKITSESWLMRDRWRTIDVKTITTEEEGEWSAEWGREEKRGRVGLATYPKKLSTGAVRKILSRALFAQGLRNALPEGVNRHEVKEAHGYRKFFKTRAEQEMRPLNVELLMGHKLGLQGSYYKPTEKEVLNDYLKAVPALTIQNDIDKSALQKQVTELTEKSEEANYVIKGKLAEKEKEFETMKEKIDLMELGFRHFIETGVLDPFLAGDSSRSGDLRSVLEERRKEIRSR